MDTNSKPPSPQDEKEELTATSRVLKFVRGEDANQEALADAWDYEQEKIELDERWLITYADKMSLLCGLFVMLFAMSTIDKGKFERLKASAAQTFGLKEKLPWGEKVDYETQVIEMRTTIEQLQKETAERAEQIRLQNIQISDMTQKIRTLEEAAVKPPPPTRGPARRRW